MMVSCSEIVLEVVRKGSDFRYILKVEGMELKNHKRSDLMKSTLESHKTTVLEYEHTLSLCLNKVELFSLGY